MATRKKRPAPAAPAKPGRPSKYKADYARQARMLCAHAAATDAELAEFFGVVEQTINNWKHDHPEFKAALEEGKAVSDDAVERALFARAVGYSHEAEKILTVSDGNGEGSHVERVPYTEHYPPDPTSMIFWLKNRRPDRWRDKQEMEHQAGESFAALCAAAFGKGSR